MCYANQAVQLAVNGTGAEKKTPDGKGGGSSAVSSGQSVVSNPTTPPAIAKQPDSSNQSNGNPSPGYAEVKPSSAVEPITVKEPPALSVAPQGGGLLRKTGIPGLSSVSLQSIHEEIAEAESNQGPVKEAKLTLDDLKEAWAGYIDSIDKDSVKTILRGAEIDISPEQVTVTVGSALAENTVRQETDLMGFLRERLHAPLLALQIKLDPSRSNAAPARPKRLTDSEKYHAMRAINPLVDEMRKRFDLSLENE